MTTVHEVIDAVSEYIDAAAEQAGRSINDTRDAMHAGEYGEKGKAAYAVWYAWQYDGIDGGASERWLSLAE